MPNKIIVGMQVHNEQNRYLERVLESIFKFADKLIIVDDASTDGTVKEIKSICNKNNFRNLYMSNLAKNLFSINESLIRNDLFNLCYSSANSGDWIFIIDADEEIYNSNLIKLILFDEYTKEAEIFGMRLFDMWSETEFRSDDLWNAHLRLFPFAVKKPDFGQNLNTIRGKLHCGRFPSCYSSDLKSIGAIEVLVKHWGWSTKKDRIEKYSRYLKDDPNGIWGSKKQYESICDENPTVISFDSYTRGGLL